MIKLSPRPPAPEFFQSAKFKKFVDRLWNFHLAGGIRATQNLFFWEKWFEPFKSDAMTALNHYFKGKCAYTEAKLTYDNGSLMSHAQMLLHRPASDAIDTDGTVSPDHYWWLIPDWSNWYLASGSVASVKANRFPVKGERATVPKKRKSTPEMDEKSLLLDPCKGDDDPVWYLQFLDTGHVTACDAKHGKIWSYKNLPINVQHPGIHTIQTLDLNNARLVRLRRLVSEDTIRKLRSLKLASKSMTNNISFNFIQETISRDQSFAAAARQSACRWLLDLLKRYKQKKIDNPNRIILDMIIRELASEVAVAVICSPTKLLTFTSIVKELLTPIAEMDSLSQLTDVKKQFLHALDIGEQSKISLPSPPKKVELNRIAYMNNLSGSFELAHKPVPKVGLVLEQKPLRPVIDRSAYIKSISIKNFKAIHQVNLDTSNLGDGEKGVELKPNWKEDAPTIFNARRWWTFLGENGSGKSSIIQAVGLALAGEHIQVALEEARLSWRDLLRRPPINSNEKVQQGRICLEFSNGIRIDLRFNANKHWWVKSRLTGEDQSSAQPRSGVPKIQAFVRGYGPTRLLESGSLGSTNSPGGKPKIPINLRIGNLFDPRAPGIDTERWLLNLSKADFNVAAVTIASMLEEQGLEQGTAEHLSGKIDTQADDSSEPLFKRNKNRVLVDGLPLALVSDGYRAIVTMLCDIMSGLGEGVSNIAKAPGIVLIDEIGAHLHPRWRMSITHKLRRALPMVQFIVSTHEPLCLRGLVSKEVVRVHKHRRYGAITEIVERSPSNYRVDQLLTSEYFGLQTTIDPDMERRFMHYYQLRAIPEERRSQKEKEEFEYLRRYLYVNARPSFGSTRRDQIVCEEIDNLLSEEYRKEPEAQSREEYIKDRIARRKATLEKVHAIWELRSAAHGYGVDL